MNSLIDIPPHLYVHQLFRVDDVYHARLTIVPSTGVPYRVSMTISVAPDRYVDLDDDAGLTEAQLEYYDHWAGTIACILVEDFPKPVTLTDPPRVLFCYTPSRKEFQP